MPVGPFAMQDIAGIDVGARIRQYLRSIGKHRAEGPQSAVPDWLYDMGRYGQKTGAGWYRYEPGSRTPIPDPLIDELARKAAAERGIEHRAISEDEIVARIMTALANEGANILQEGYRRCVPATSTSFTSTASVSRATAAALCSTPIPSDSPLFSTASSATAINSAIIGAPHPY